MALSLLPKIEEEEVFFPLVVWKKGSGYTEIRGKQIPKSQLKYFRHGNLIDNNYIFVGVRRKFGLFGPVKEVIVRLR